MRTTDKRWGAVGEELPLRLRDQEQGNRCRLRAGTTKSDREEGEIEGREEGRGSRLRTKPTRCDLLPAGVRHGYGGAGNGDEGESERATSDLRASCAAAGCGQRATSEMRTGARSGVREKNERS